MKKKAKKQNLPLVSVFLPTYNHENFLAECLDSILTQDYENIEIVCGDDCSTDGTKKILKKYAQLYPKKIKAICNKENLGTTRNCNNILRHCTGKYVVFFSGDDIMLPGKISKLICFLEDNPEFVLCYHDIEVFDSETGKKVCNYTDVSRSPSGEVTSLLTPNTFVAGPAFAALRAALPREGYNENIKVISDWLFIIETATRGKIGYIPEVLTRYRRHHNNLSNKLTYYHEYFIALGILKGKYWYLSKAIRLYEGFTYKCFMVNFLKKQEFDNAFICANEAFFRFYSWHLFLPFYIVGCLRKGFLKSPIDKLIHFLFVIAKRMYEAKRVNYKLYQNNKR
jgi:glycosyltransferase involved in cell wall biosynthesis